MSARIENWIQAQRRMVGPDAVCVATVMLIGPDGDAWGTWPIDQEELTKEIQALIDVQGEERPSGVYPCKLVGLDEHKNQIALLPIRIHGRAAGAIGQGGEAISMQRATGLAVGTLEQVIMTQGNHVETLAKMNESLIEDRAILLEEFNKQQSVNLDVELRMREWERRMQREDMIVALVKEYGGPAIVQFLNAWTENQEEERQRRKEQRALQERKYPPGWPDPDEKPEATAPDQAPPEAPGADALTERLRTLAEDLSPAERAILRKRLESVLRDPPAEPDEKPEATAEPASATMGAADVSDDQPADGVDAAPADAAGAAPTNGGGSRKRRSRSAPGRSRRKTPKGRAPGPST